MGKKPYQKFIYKLPSERLRKADWNLNLPLEDAIKNKNDIVALSDSQLLRWIDEINGMEDTKEKIVEIKQQIKYCKKQTKSNETKRMVKELYDELYNLQFQKDYFCMIMNSNKDYDRANKGFKINGITYKRLLGTNGGTKKSTIVYINELLYDEVKERLDNGRNKITPLVPAKLEAYQALICSASIPVTMPKFLIVNDCMVNFKEDVIKINDENDGEPKLTYENDYEIEYCDSDGYGLMSPEYSRIVNGDLYGEEYQDQTITGINTRFAWTKGMLFTFDFKEFAKQKNNNDFIVKDAWGSKRDIRDYDIILTTSMVKLWDLYNSLEDYEKCCRENHYQFSVSKAAPHKLENVRNANYQFLQSYDFTDNELYELCKPTIDEISDVLGDDWRKTIVFLKGMFLNENNIDFMENDFIKALMIDKTLIKDPFIIEKVHSMIKKRINMSAKG